MWLFQFFLDSLNFYLNMNITFLMKKLLSAMVNFLIFLCTFFQSNEEKRDENATGSLNWHFTFCWYFLIHCMRCLNFWNCLFRYLIRFINRNSRHPTQLHSVGCICIYCFRLYCKHHLKYLQNPSTGEKILLMRLVVWSESSSKAIL